MKDASKGRKTKFRISTLDSRNDMKFKSLQARHKLFISQKKNKQTNKRSLRPMKLVTKLPKPLFLTSPKDEFNKS